MKFVLALRPSEILSNTSVYVSVNVGGCAAAVPLSTVPAPTLLGVKSATAFRLSAPGSLRMGIRGHDEATART